MDTFCRTAFSPEMGFFSGTSQNTVTPRPFGDHHHKICHRLFITSFILDFKVPMIAGSYLEYYRFIGQMVGKAIYEVLELFQSSDIHEFQLQRILVESQFCGSFLNFLVARVNEFDDLIYLDPEVNTL